MGGVQELPMHCRTVHDCDGLGQGHLIPQPALALHPTKLHSQGSRHMGPECVLQAWLDRRSSGVKRTGDQTLVF